MLKRFFCVCLVILFTSILFQHVEASRNNNNGELWRFGIGYQFHESKANTLKKIIKKFGHQSESLYPGVKILSVDGTLVSNTEAILKLFNKAGLSGKENVTLNIELPSGKRKTTTTPLILEEYQTGSMLLTDNGWEEEKAQWEIASTGFTQLVHKVIRSYIVANKERLAHEVGAKVMGVTSALSNNSRIISILDRNSKGLHFQISNEDKVWLVMPAPAKNNKGDNIPISAVSGVLGLPKTVEGGNVMSSSGSNMYWSFSISNAHEVVPTLEKYFFVAVRNMISSGSELLVADVKKYSQQKQRASLPSSGRDPCMRGDTAGFCGDVNRADDALILMMP